MKKQFLTAVITVIFAGLIATGCSGKNPAAGAMGENDTVQATKEYVADIYGTEGMTETKESSVTGPEATYPEGQTENENVDGQTVPEKAQTDKGETKTEGGEQQTEPSAAAPGTTTTQPEEKAPAKAPEQSSVKPEGPAQPEEQAQTKSPAQSTVKPGLPAQPETQAPTKAPAQNTVKPSAPAQPETKAPAQSAPKPSVPAQPETQAPTKSPTQSTPKPTTPAQPETQAPVKAPETPKKEKTMWDAPYDVEAIKAYMVTKLTAEGYINAENFEAMNKWVKDSWGTELDYEEYKKDIEKFNPLGEYSGAWDNFCTATAGPNRYYDSINHCTVGHQHYNRSKPATGAGERKNSDGLTSLEFYVNDAINYWCYMYGEGHMFPEEYREESKFPTFLIYTEKFDDGCVIFYIIAGI